MSLQQSFDASQTWDMNSLQAQTITKLISEMIDLDNQPFLISEDLGFVRLMKHLAPRYHLPSRHHFSDTVIPNLVERAEAAVGKMLENAKHFSFTSDIWTFSHTNDSFISLTGHWIDEQDTKASHQSIVLKFLPWQLLVHLKLKMEDSGSVIRNQAVISYAAKTKDTFTKSPWTSIAKQRW